MKTNKFLRSEQNVNSLSAGEQILINGKSYMFRQGDSNGVEFVRFLGNGQVHKLKVRGYDLDNGALIPIWYSDNIIQLGGKTK